MSDEKDNPPSEGTPEPEAPPTQHTPETGKAKQPSLLRNYVSFIGGAIAFAALTSIILLILIELSSGDHDNPYAVLVTYILLPGVLLFGLAIVLLGVIIERRRRKKNPDLHMAAYPVLDLNDPARRRSFVVFLVLGFLFLFMTAFGSYRAFEYTESVEFCGQQCHAVMKPEFIAHKATSHAKVRCVDCHVGGGAEWYVRSKFNGMNQLYSVTFNSFDRPIKTPVHPPMRKANETCGKCHWPEKFLGDEMRVFNHYGFDEKNTLNQIRLLIKVGGGNPETGEAGGIHWHMNLGNEIDYIAMDERRQDIPWVRIKDKTGRVVEYLDNTSKLTAQQIEQSEKRRMDCIDCHNRPAHNYLSPNAAVDQSLTAGKLDATLPFVKAKAVEVLSADYKTEDEAVAAIASGLDNYYRTAHADVYSGRGNAVRGAIAEVQRIYQTNFFPEMKTDWRAHFNNVGHFNAQGCFRCHDGQHVSRDGQVIRNDCAICHTTLDQTFGGVTTQPPNGMFQHPVNLGDKNTWQCAACHKGDRSFKHPINLGDISQFQCAQCHTGGYEKVNYK